MVSLRWFGLEKSLCNVVESDKTAAFQGRKDYSAINIK